MIKALTNKFENMYQIRVYIDDFYCNIYVDIFLPAIPRKGEKVILTQLQKEALEQQVKNNEECWDSFKRWIWDIASPRELLDIDVKKEDIEYLSFINAEIVSGVEYLSNSEIIKISLGRSSDGFGE